jgi:uncharacterized protein YndB with AHSA1/START domain
MDLDFNGQVMTALLAASRPAQKRHRPDLSSSEAVRYELAIPELWRCDVIESDVTIARPPAEVFSYVTDPSRFGDWQSGVVSAHLEGDEPAHVGSRCTMTRRVRGSERSFTSEITKLDPPATWAMHGIDGPVRADVTVTVEPVSEGRESHVTIQVDFHGHGIGKVLLPGVVREARQEGPQNCQNLKRQLEGSQGTTD